MNNISRTLQLGVLFHFLSIVSLSSHAGNLRVGESEGVYSLASDNSQIRGLAWDETSSHAPRLFVLDGSGKVFSYKHKPTVAQDMGNLELLRTHDLKSVASFAGLDSPRGLAFAVEGGCPVLYFLDWRNSRSHLYRYSLDGAESASVDLSLAMYRIGDREALDVAYDEGRTLVSFDASGYADPHLRVQRGILWIEWDGAFGERPARVRHLPDAGTSPAHGIAAMQLDGADYLWATVGDDHIYCGEARTGRGLFFFDRPRSHEDSPSCWGLCFGQDALWVSENVPGPDRVHRVNVCKNLDAPLEGPRVPRRLIMTIRSEPETDATDAGVVSHTYSRPYGYEQLHNQGIWPETETIIDVSTAANATVLQIAQDPAGDTSSRQIMRCVEYANAPARSYASQYEIDLWTNAYKKFVYPHRVNRNQTALDGANYLADDAVLYNLSDAATYTAFMKRVVAHVEGKYGVEADMQNPYWAARNIVEYIQDNYYYPSRPKGKPATVDYNRQHYDANPGNLKIELSARQYDKTQIIACSGTSVMVAGAARHLGIPSRWLGTGTQRGPDDWDRNANGLLDPDETAVCSNGHRYTQVWLGSHYGWICFDATPSKPALNDYDPPPPLQSQWRYMTRAASGHREEKRIVFNVGSELVRPLYREFEYDPRLAIDNNCGGDQRYNLQGRCEKPGLWKLAGHGICVKNLCFIDDVVVSGTGAAASVAWQLQGAWDRIANATVSLHLQQSSANAGRWRNIARLARNIPCNTGSVSVDLSGHRGKQFRVILRRDGDTETGGTSPPFDLDGIPTQAGQ
jgi:transglutaminase-like putative cysteine protease